MILEIIGSIGKAILDIILMLHPAIRWIIVGILMLIFLFCAIENSYYYWLIYIKKEKKVPSPIPLVGGISGMIAIAIMPILKERLFFVFIPLILDVGTLFPILILPFTMLAVLYTTCKELLSMRLIGIISILEISVGIIGTLFLLFGLCSFVYGAISFITQGNSEFLYLSLKYVIVFVPSLLVLYTGSKTFHLKPRGRKLSVFFVAPFSIILSLIAVIVKTKQVLTFNFTFLLYLLPALFGLIVIIYLNRPTVKEQFKEKCLG